MADDLIRPQTLSGSAVDRDRTVKERGSNASDIPGGRCIHGVSLNATCDECWGEELEKHPIHHPSGAR